MSLDELTLMDWIKTLDIFSLLAMVVTLGLAGRGIYFLACRRDRGMCRPLGFLTLLPLLIGLMGTFLLTFRVELLLLNGCIFDPVKAIRVSFGGIRHPSYVGFFGSVVLIIIESARLLLSARRRSVGCEEGYRHAGKS